MARHTGPVCKLCRRFTPKLAASRPQFSAATVAANEVDFFEPLKPDFPAEPHATVLPLRSEIVIKVLLNVAVMCATPSASTVFFTRLPDLG